MNAGVKTYTKGINVTPNGVQLETIAHRAQRAGYRVGVVTSVPFSDATPGAAYAHNVSRDDWQDIARDLLGLPSISHPSALSGMDVVIGAGFGMVSASETAQGENYEPGNPFVAEADLVRVDARHGGRYVVAQRASGVKGGEALAAAAQLAVQDQKRLVGLYGLGGKEKYAGGHLPFASADGDYRPAPGIDGQPITYSAADLLENPTLAEMTSAAVTVLTAGQAQSWLLVEAGDVDWANHANNIDASIGAVISGEAAVRVITDWVELHSNWQESALIITGDHGHYLQLDRPEVLLRSEE
jgi:alkaline phosphatase